MIETERLLIKPLNSNELRKLIDSPGELAKDLGLITTETLVNKETKEAIISDLLPNIDDPGKDALFYTMWIVILKSQKAIVGGICFHGEPDETGEVEIGYGTDNEYRNKGIMTETISRLIQWIRTNKNVKRIKAETDSENISSLRILQKNNFRICERNDNSVILRIEL